MVVGGMETAVAGAITLPSQFFGIFASQTCDGTVGENACFEGAFPANIMDDETKVFDQYDGSSGELEGVWLTFTVIESDASIFTQVGLENNDQEPDLNDLGQIQSEIMASFFVDLNGSELWALPTNPVMEHTSCDTSSNGTDCISSSSKSLVTDLSFMISLDSGDDLSPFMGGGTFDLTPNFSGEVDYSGSGDNVTSASGYSSVSWQGRIDVEYHLRMDNAVPSPAPLWLLGAGLAGWAGSRIRRRKSDQNSSSDLSGAT